MLAGSLLCMSTAYASETATQSSPAEQGAVSAPADDAEAEQAPPPAQASAAEAEKECDAAIDRSELQELSKMAEDLGLIQAEAQQSPETAEAQNELGMRYFLGHGKGKDFYLAADYFRKAAEQGDAMAQYNLGRCYHFVKNAEDAAIWYKKAAEQGYVRAQAALGEYYLEGIGVKKDELLAFKWLRKAAEQGDSVAQYNLGKCYEVFDAILPSDTLGEGIWTADPSGTAFCLYSMAAEQGVVEAQLRLAHCYMYGRGIGKSAEEAVKLYEKVASAGLDTVHQQAGIELAKCYLYGKGVKQDMEKAFGMIKSYADKVPTKVNWKEVPGFIGRWGARKEAIYTYAKCLLYGWGCEQDKKTAKKILKELGNYRAAETMLKTH